VANPTKVTYEANTNGLGTNVLTFAYDQDNRLSSMVDAVGSSAYTYANGLLASEDGPWTGDTVSYAYANGLRQSLTLQQPNASAWQESYGFDGGLRLTNVTSPAGVFGYTYAGPGTWVTNLAFPGGLAITNSYDALGRLTGTWLRAADGTILNRHQYNYNVASQRTRQTRAAGDYVDYSYDGIGQLQTAQGKESGGTSRLQEQMGYGYDAGGNLHYRTNNTVAAEPLVQTFSVDNVNQLTNVSRTGKLTVAGGTSSSATNVTVNGLTANRYTDNTFAKDGFTLSGGADTFTAVAQDAYGRADTNALTVTMPASVSLVYDDNGNLTSDGLRGFGYDAENQLVQVTVTNNWRSEFTYDGFGRRRVRTEYVWQNNAWVVQAVVRYVYDGLLVMQERDGNNVPQVTYTRGRDLSGSRQRAGGIGGLLARTDNAILISGASRAHAYYHADGNGNITFLATDKATVAARYLYDPFGNLLAKAGPLADANLYRFSSKELHANSGLYYYGFRFYEPGLQRWASRDPIAERAGINLYGFVDNSPVAQVDLFGLYDDDAHDPYIKEDHCFWSHPYTPWGYWRHFRRLDKVEKDLAKDVAQGKYERFKRHMHQGQDYFAHYRMGYRWYTLGHAFAGHAPDVRFRDHPVEWQNYLLMLAWTADWEAMWRAQNEADDPWTD
jgi:RHS repeat-associated protein